MSDETPNPVHWSFWAVGAVALIWNLMGVVNYLAQTNADVEFNTFETIMMTVMPIVGAIFLVWYSKWVQSKGWIS